MNFGDSFYNVLRFLNKFSINVLIKKLEFKSDSSLNFIFAEYFKLLFIIKYEHCGGYSIK